MLNNIRYMDYNTETKLKIRSEDDHETNGILKISFESPTTIKNLDIEIEKINGEFDVDLSYNDSYPNCKEIITNFKIIKKSGSGKVKFKVHENGYNLGDSTFSFDLPE